MIVSLIFSLLFSLGQGQSGACTVSWYGGYFHGRLTACGEVYDMNELSCAHKELPMGTIVQFYYPETERGLTLIVNDRGPYIDGRDFDFSRAAFDSLFKDLDIGVAHNVSYVVVGREIRPTMRYNL